MSSRVHSSRPNWLLLLLLLLLKAVDFWSVDAEFNIIFIHTANNKDDDSDGDFNDDDSTNQLLLLYYKKWSNDVSVCWIERNKLLLIIMIIIMIVIINQSNVIGGKRAALTCAFNGLLFKLNSWYGIQLEVLLGSVTTTKDVTTLPHFRNKLSIIIN